MQRTFGAALGLALLACAHALHGQSPVAVQHFDPPKYTGTWYEIAHYPNRREKNCTRNVVHGVAEGDKPRSIQFVNACMTNRGYADASNVSARPQDKSGDGKMKISTFWPFTRKYWILAVGPEYDWSLTGNPNRKELWIFSRQPTLDPGTLAQIEAKADAMGYNTAKLMMTSQTQR